MKTLILFLLIGLSVAGCSTTEKSMNHVPWYEHLNPATDQTTSDWSLFDLDTASYQRETSMVDDAWTDAVEMFW